MIKIVMDANLFVSAILTSNGNPAKILDLVREEEIKLVVSLPVLEEVKRVLLYPRIKKIHGFSEVQIEQELNKVVRFANLTPGKLKIKAIRDDPTDNKYLECAIEGSADFIVSGDSHLKDLKIFKGIKVVSPTEFLRIIFVR